MRRAVHLSDDERAVLRLVADPDRSGASMVDVAHLVDGETIVSRAHYAARLLARLEDHVGAVAFDWNLSLYRVTPWGRALLALDPEASPATS